jgi:hypothetical protein
MLLDMLNEASLVGFMVGILFAQLGLWLKLRSFINAQTKFLAERMTEQNRHVNPLLENIREQIRQALREAHSEPLGGHPYRDSPANTAALPDFEHMQPEPVVLTDWVPGTACPFCATDTDQEDPTQAAARPADGATPARPYLTWHCHYCELKCSERRRWM